MSWSAEEDSTDIITEFTNFVLKSDLPIKGTEKQPFGEGANPWHLTSPIQVQLSYGYKLAPFPLPPPQLWCLLKKTLSRCPYTQPFKVSLPPSEGSTEDAV